MPQSLTLSRSLLLVTIAALIPPLTAVAAGFEPVTAEERAFATVPWEPDAAAVVLFEKAELDFMDYPSEVSSILEVHTRIKVLKEAGKEHGEVAIAHSARVRLKEFEGRTILPDGTVVPLTEDAIFREESSRTRKRYLTKAAFPAVEVGSIIDYRFKVRWDDLAYLEPWYFHHTIPTVLSKITYYKPGNMSLEPRSWATGGAKIEFDTQRTPKGLAIRAWVNNLGGIPEEPLSFPFADLSSRFMLVPKEVSVSGTRWPLFDSWVSTYEHFEDGDTGYKNFRRSGKQAKKKALELASGAASLRAQVAAIHAFVRDEIRTQPSGRIGVGGSKADEILKAGEGYPAEKALLLQTMLGAVKAKPALVWAADRREGRIDLAVANPWWFEKVLVMVELEGQRVFLDASDRRLGFGRLSPHSEGTPAVLHSKKPEIIELPVAPLDQNVRRAKVDLTLDGEGRVVGQGQMVLSGHHAWRFLRWKDDEEATAEAWQERLDGFFEGYEVSEVTVGEALDEQRVEVQWQVAQLTEDVLGDEASLVPSLPLGPVEQLFNLPTDRRKTPVQFSFADRDEVEMTVSWPDGWEIDVLPEKADYIGPAGALLANVEVDEANRRLTYSRRLDITTAEFLGREHYAAIRDLYSEAEGHDAQSLVLVRR